LRSRPSPALKLAIAGAVSQGAAIGVGRFVFTPILPSMTAALHLTAGQAGWIGSANFAGYLVGALIATAPAFARAARAWLLLALVISALTTAAMGWVQSLPLFMAIRGVGGLASAFVLVFGSGLVLQRLAREGREGLSALHFAGVGSAVLISAIATSLMAAAGLDWRAMWWVNGALTAIALLAVAWLMPPPAPSAPAEAAIPPGEAKTGAVSLLIAYGLFGFGYVITATFIVAIVKTYPAAAAVRPYVWMLVGAAAIPSVALWTVVGRRIGVRRAFALACVAEAFGVAISVIRPTWDGAVIASLLLGGTFMGITALGLVAAREAHPNHTAKALGRMTAAFGLGQMIGPASAGWLAQRVGGFEPASLIASGALLVSAALTAFRD
jgi:predicted MFS family arabinose efflux permease